MFLTFEDRPSDSPLVERVWHCHNTKGGTFHSMAEGNLELVVARIAGETHMVLRGPVTKAEPVECPPEGQWFAIRFKPGTYFPGMPTPLLMNHSDLWLPSAGTNRFWFNRDRWEVPDFEHAETFVSRLVRRGLIRFSHVTHGAIEGDTQVLSRRSIQRHFRSVTGLTHAQFRQIERARYAAALLRNGASILDVTHEAGYFDQAHLGRSLKHLIGHTPAAIQQNNAQLSFLSPAEEARLSTTLRTG